MLKNEGADRPEVLVVHAGDALSPSLFSGFDKGAHMIELLNLLPLDIFTPGNHEFDFGKEVAKQRFSEARFPIVSANITEPDGTPFAGVPPTRSSRCPASSSASLASRHRKLRKLALPAT